MLRWGKDFLPFDFLLGLVQNATSQGKLGRRGRKTSAFEMVLSPEAKQNIFMTALRWLVSRENH